MGRWFTILALLISFPALAGPLEERKAAAHLDAVAAGAVEVLMSDYADDATFDWVGGPLDGRYRGKEQIRELWRKFIAANDGNPRPAIFGKARAYANPKGVSIGTEAEYGGKSPVKVWHVLVYHDGALITELWQIDPTIKVGP